MVDERSAAAHVMLNEILHMNEEVEQDGHQITRKRAQYDAEIAMMTQHRQQKEEELAALKARFREQYQI